jgi:hypothetical protein
MASKGQLTGMLGVYLVAAELTRNDFIVSVTSRSAAGADLLVTDSDCKNPWSVQVKTNRKPANFWLVNPDAQTLCEDRHMYVFVNIGDEKRPDEFIVVPSSHVSKKVVKQTSRTGSVWYSFMRADGLVLEQPAWKQFKSCTATTIPAP